MTGPPILITPEKGISGRMYSILQFSYFFCFLEFTVYGGQYYGCRAEDVKQVLDSGKNAVMPIDICGAIAVKNAFPDRCLIVFTDRSRTAVLKGILNMNCPEDEKVLRILSLDSEFQNRDICDSEVDMNKGAQSCAADLLAILQQ